MFSELVPLSETSLTSLTPLLCESAAGRLLHSDSRKIQPGDIFVACQGEYTDGRSFIPAAIANGAAFVFWDDDGSFAWQPEWQVPNQGIKDLKNRAGILAAEVYGNVSDGHANGPAVWGVTGTNGKTSVTQWLAQAADLLEGRQKSCAVIGTVGNGFWGELVEATHTTPDPVSVQTLLHRFKQQGARAVAMEVSSHGLDQARVNGVPFQTAVFTNLTRDHLDYHGDMASYGAAKARLFDWPGLRAAAVNLDDAFGRELFAAVGGKVRAIGFSSRGAAGASVRAEGLHLAGRGIRFMLHAGGQAHPVRSPLLGRFNVDNLLAVAATLFALGMAPALVAETLSQLVPVDGRMNRLGGEAGQPLVVIDYAHTPDALEQALASLRGHAAGRLLCVFGCGGERDTGKRPQMAAIAERLADRVVVTDDNPRREDGDAIVAGILAGFADPSRVVVQRDRARAIALAIAEAGADDVVLVAGKGHEPYQEIDGIRHPFDDTEVARDLLRARAA